MKKLIILLIATVLCSSAYAMQTCKHTINAGSCEESQMAQCASPFVKGTCAAPRGTNVCASYSQTCAQTSFAYKRTCIERPTKALGAEEVSCYCAESSCIGKTELKSKGGIKTFGMSTVIDPGASLDVKGDLKIGGKPVLADADELSRARKAVRVEVPFCGDADAVNGSALHFGPDLTLAYPGLKCDLANEGGTLANVQKAVFDRPVSVVGIDCRVEGDLGADVVFSLEADGAKLPGVSCAIPDGGRFCSSNTAYDDPISSDKKWAVAVESAGSLPTTSKFICQAHIAY